MHAAANWNSGSVNGLVTALHLLRLCSSMGDLTTISYSNIMQSLIEQLKIVTNNTKETFIITNDKSEASESLYYTK